MREIPDPIAERVIAEVKPYQLAVIGPVSDGMRNRAIGRMLGTSEQSIKNRLRAVYDATGMDSRLQLALFVLDHPALRLAADEALKARMVTPGSLCTVG
jgi:DNA-binding NarL/FixJ family response regulator